MLIKCTCTNANQDALNGKGIRVCNVKKDNTARCTVCGTLHKIATEKKDEKK